MDIQRLVGTKARQNPAVKAIDILEQLMIIADVKNYTLASELQYDVSYISKCVSGRMLPAEKNRKIAKHTVITNRRIFFLRSLLLRILLFLILLSLISAAS